MCRSLEKGGRRCPRCYGAQRRSTDRARYAAKKATLPQEQETSPILTPAAPALSWNPVEIKNEAEEVRMFFEINTISSGISETRVPLAQYRENPEKYQERDKDSLVIPYESPQRLEQRVSKIGEQISQRATEILGYDPETKIAELEKVEEQKRAEFEELENQVIEARKRSSEATTAFVKDKNNKDLEDASRAALKELERVMAEKARLRKTLQLEYSPEVKEVLRETAEAYKQAISEVRELGGTVEVRKDSSKRATSVLQDAASVYPREWVERSNFAGNLRVKDTQSRAHYSGKKGQKTKEYRMTHASFGMTEEPPPGSGWVDTGRTTETISYDGPEPEMVTMRVFERPYMFSTRPALPGDKKPRGWIEYYAPVEDVGWEFRPGRPGVPPELSEYVQTKDPKLKPDDETPPGMVRVWGKPSSRMVEREVCAELLVDKSKREQHSDVGGFATAVHEFAHRCEHTTPALGAAEEAFLQRRTTTPDGDREPLKSLYPGTREKGREDSFAHAYMGKEYPDAVPSAMGSVVPSGAAKLIPEIKGSVPRSDYREVMSCGMEALFGGSFGGLLGAGKYKADPDMRHFILGALTTL